MTQTTLPTLTKKKTVAIAIEIIADFVTLIPLAKTTPADLVGLAMEPVASIARGIKSASKTCL